ncbi:DALR anticodon-binding domain-containing protein [Streptomonospora alba]|uniref:DALR anticodon-binding domain-containing protein n=1 Tax=Streptomonospora alba TaxID=183763 RepID=UPI00069BA8DB|nr:DALR anticodon-binding domain-containing protein [Streptomonospora alba]
MALDGSDRWWRSAGATPRRVDALLRSAVAAAAECPLESVPPAEPRRVASAGGAQYSTALPLRLAGSLGVSASGVAETAAALLRGVARVDGARVQRGGFVALDVASEARAAMVHTAAADGAAFLGDYLGYLRGLGRLDVTEPDRAAPADERASAAPLPPPSPLHGAATAEEARRLAREDARRRMRALAGHPGAEADGACIAVQPGDVSWREPCIDSGGGDTPAGRLLAVIGEAGARVAFCRAAAERPRAGEETGPGLPAVPTAEHPGAWALGTRANPAFVLRYAHAHAVSSLRWAGEAQAAAATAAAPALAPVPLEEPAAAALAGALYDGPLVLHAARRRSEPHMLVRYLEGVAAAYHEWRGSGGLAVEAAVESAGGGSAPALGRMRLCAAAAGVLHAGLSLLGVPAPTRL